MRKKVFVILYVWTTTVVWHLHFYRTWAGSPIPSSFGMNIDWTRNHIVQSGNLGDVNSWTQISAWIGSHNYDHSSIFLAIVNIVTGTQHLVEALTAHNIFQIVGVFLLPVIFLYWYSSIEVGEFSWFGAYLILLLSYFASHTIILKNSSGWFPENFAVANLMLIIVLIPKSVKSSRLKFLQVVLIFFMFNLYHTFVLFFLLIIGSIFLFDTLYSSKISNQRVISAGLFFLIISVFFFVGDVLNNRFLELVQRVFTGLFSASTTPASAIEGDLVASSTATSALQNPNRRQIGKIINHLSSVLVVFVFMISHISRRYLGQHDSLNSIRERTILLSMSAFPFILVGFYLFYNQIGQTVTRTQYIGIYFVVLAAALLLRHPHNTYRKLTTILVILMVASAVPTAILIGVTAPLHSLEEERAIEYTGTHLEERSYVFSDSVLGMPLGYYNLRGIVIVRTLYDGWEDQLTKIYYQSNPHTALKSIESTIDNARISNSPNPSNFYIFLSSSPKQNGVGLLSETTTPTNVDPRNKFSQTTQVQKIYTTGNITLFSHE